MHTLGIAEEFFLIYALTDLPTAPSVKAARGTTGDHRRREHYPKRIFTLPRRETQPHRGHRPQALHTTRSCRNALADTARK